jgi:ABC-type branched-subunit amino acid transport system substrate-binding protein
MLSIGLCVVLAAAVTAGCEKKSDADAKAKENAATTETGAEEGGLKTDKGVDADAKTIKIGALNDESGPAATIGKPYAIGKRILAAQANAEGSELLPEGWKVELVEKDHGYNPQNSVQAYREIKDDVLLIGTSFGTPNTLPLRQMLEQDNLLAFPASLSSKMAEHEHTPPLAPPYFFEAMRAMDHAVEAAGDPKAVKAGIIYQDDDYGQDGIYGWELAAEHHGVDIVSKQTIAAGQKDFAAVVTALKEAGATHVLLTALPSASGPILGTAAQLKYMPVWYGNTPTWIDLFYNPETIPSAVFTNFHLVTGVPFWGEDVPGMKEFVAAFEKHRPSDDVQPDFYILLSYLQGLSQLEAAKTAIEKGDITRAGYLAAFHELTAFDGNGMMQPVNFSKVPYLVGDKVRVLKPDFENKSWTVVSDYAAPKGAEKVQIDSGDSAGGDEANEETADEEAAAE